MPKNNAKRIQRMGQVVEAGGQNVMVGAQSSSSPIVSIMFSIIHILVGYHTHFGPLPQPLTPLSGFFLHYSWAFLGIAIQPLEWLFTTWVACNLLECLFLHCLHPHSSPSSSMLSLAVLGIYSSSIRLIVRLIHLCSFMGSSDKSAC